MITHRARKPSVGAFLLMAAWSWTLVLAIVCLSLRWSDEYVLPTLVSYGPRWIWGVPLLLLVPAAVLRRTIALPIAVGVLIVAGPLMQFELGRTRGGGPAPDALTVMTLNADSEEIEPGRLVGLAREYRPDVVAVQECREEVAHVLRDRLAWKTTWYRGLCLASRYPMSDGRVLERANGDGALAIAETVHTARGPVVVFNVHLETVREGLEPMIHLQRGSLGLMRENFEFRQRESESVVEFIGADRDRAVIAGDFNMPTTGAIYREVWSPWTNAFEAAGRGYGYTKFTSWHGIRIDQILVGQSWRVLQARVGPWFGSDHRPLVAAIARW